MLKSRKLEVLKIEFSEQQHEGKRGKVPHLTSGIGLHQTK
jgi:hypothetical protein